MDLHLNGKAALVTGSTAGIGLEIARKLAVEGAKVIICGRNQAKLKQAVDDIRASGGAGVSGVLANVIPLLGSVGSIVFVAVSSPGPKGMITAGMFLIASLGFVGVNR